MKGSAFEHVSVKPDLTKTQQVADKVLRLELKATKASGKSAMIRRGRVVVIRNDGEEVDQALVAPLGH